MSEKCPPARQPSSRLFSTSGIRGIFGKEVTLDLAINVGLALGTTLNKKSKIVIGRDPRKSSLALENALCSGIESTGVSVLKLGMIPTPVLAYSTRELGVDAGVMVTASHNPPEYNGVKLWNKDSSAYTSEQERTLETTIREKKFRRVDWRKIGHSKDTDVSAKYSEFIRSKVNISKKYKIALDCGNGAASIIGPEILKNFASELKRIFSEPDGNFPGRPPEPTKENLERIREVVKKNKLDVGFAYDGDADRVAVIDENGNFVEQDKVLALFAKNALEKKGVVVVPINTSKLVEDVVEEYNGKLIQSKIGDVSVVEELKKYNGIFGGEPSGCFIFPDVHFCPDGILGSLKILEFLDNHGRKISEHVKELPEYYLKREIFECKNSEKENIVEKISNKITNLSGIEKVLKVDGTKVEFEDSWVLVRASGTEPKVRITVEANSKERLKELWDSTV